MKRSTLARLIASAAVVLLLGLYFLKILPVIIFLPCIAGVFLIFWLCGSKD